MLRDWDARTPKACRLSASLPVSDVPGDQPPEIAASDSRVGVTEHTERRTGWTSRSLDTSMSSRSNRAKVPGGWLVISQFRIGAAHGHVFLPHPNHAWDGGSLP